MKAQKGDKLYITNVTINPVYESDDSFAVTRASFKINTSIHTVTNVRIRNKWDPTKYVYVDGERKNLEQVINKYKKTRNAAIRKAINHAKKDIKSIPNHKEKYPQFWSKKTDEVYIRTYKRAITAMENLL